MDLFKQPTSIHDLFDLLVKCSRPNVNELDKNAFLSLLTGFRMITEGFETENEEITGYVAIQWLRLYLRIHSIASISDIKLRLFSKTIAVVITYIMGWLEYGPKDVPEFVNEILMLTLKLVRLADSKVLRKVENYGHRIISILWPIIDKVQTYNLQWYTLELAVLLLKNLSSAFQYQEVCDMVTCEPDELKYLLLDLTNKILDCNAQKKYSRRILNLHNDLRRPAVILSFYCKSFHLGKDLKFIKLTTDDRFWLDFNLECKTLAFEGRTYVRKEKKYWNLDVMLKIAGISIGSNKLTIQLEAPAEINGSLTNIVNDIQNIDLTYIELTKTELNRFKNALNASELGKQLTIRLPNLSSGDRFDNLNQQNTFLTHKNTSNLKVQKVQPLKKTPLDYLEEEIRAEAETEAAREPPITLDEYDDLEVSDAEPCQSYRNFQTNRPRLFADLNPRQTKKRLSSRNSNTGAAARKKQCKANDVLHSGSSTSTSVLNRLTKTPKSLTSENTVVDLNRVMDITAPLSLLSSAIMSVDESINITENSFQRNVHAQLENLPASIPAKTLKQITKPKNHKIEYASIKQKSRNLLKSKRVGERFSSTKSNSSSADEDSASYHKGGPECNQFFLTKSPNICQFKTMKQNDKFLRQQRSDIETSSDDGGNDKSLFEIQKGLKKQAENSKSHTLPKVQSTQFPSLNHSPIIDLVNCDQEGEAEVNLDNPLTGSQIFIEFEENVSSVFSENGENTSNMSSIQEDEKNLQNIQANKKFTNSAKQASQDKEDDDELLSIKAKFEIFRATCLNENYSVVADKSSPQKTFVCQQRTEDGIEKSVDSVPSSFEKTAETNLACVPYKYTCDKMNKQANPLICYQRSDHELSSEEDENHLLAKSSKISQDTENKSLMPYKDNLQPNAFNTAIINVNIGDKNEHGTAGLEKLEKQHKNQETLMEISSDEMNGEFSMHKLANETTPTSTQPTTSLIKRPQKQSNNNCALISSDSSFEPTKSLNKLSTRKRILNNNSRRLFSAQQTSDSDSSSSDFTEIVIMAKTKKRRHTIYDPTPREDILSMLGNNYGNLMPTIAKYLRK